MSLLRRAFVGALIGALFVLLTHPAARPYLVTSLHWGKSRTFRTTPLIPGNLQDVPLPNDLLIASIWMDIGAQRVLYRDKLDARDRKKLVQVANYASRNDPDNAFWPQMAAVFCYADDQREEAKQNWIRASTLTRWDDFQTKRLEAITLALSHELGGRGSWEYSSVYPLRSMDPAKTIEWYARDLTAASTKADVATLKLRLATARNGQLIRQGGRSIVIGHIGSNIIEISSYPPDIRVPATPHKLLIARSQLQDAMVEAGMRDSAQNISHIYQSNDSWEALMQREDATDTTDTMQAFSLMWATLPGGLLLCAAFGALIWGCSFILKSQPVLLRLVEPPLAPAFGVLIAAVLYRATGLPLASIAIASCFGFLAFTPAHERSNPPENLGFTFNFVLTTLAVALSLLLLVFFMGISTPGTQIMPNLGAPREFYGGSTLFLGLSGMVLGLLLLVGPSWALVQRIATAKVVVIALRYFGKGMFWTCITACVLITPIAMYVDGKLYVQMQQIVQNEPLYYLLR